MTQGLSAYSKRIHAIILGVKSHRRTLEEMMRNLRVVLALGEATNGIRLLERTIVLPTDTDRTEGARSLPSRMERRSCRRHQRRAQSRECSSRTFALEMFCTYEMCAFCHPQFRDWFAAAFKFFCVLHRAGDVTNGFMADVAAKDKIKWLERLRGVSLSGHNIRIIVAVEGGRSVRNIGR